MDIEFIFISVFPVLQVAAGILMMCLSSRLLTSAVSMHVSYKILRVILLPGVILHEYSHAIVAVLMGHKIVKVSLLGDHQGQLGYVEHAGNKNRWSWPLENLAISLAPLFTLLGIFWAITSYMDAPFQYLLLLYLCATLAPSFQDIKNGINGLIFIALCLLVINFFSYGSDKLIEIADTFSLLSAISIFSSLVVWLVFYSWRFLTRRI